MRLTNLTWPKAQEYFEKNDMVLISIGSIECHGRHMPLGTDTLIPEHLLEKIEKKSDVLIAPGDQIRVKINTSVELPVYKESALMQHEMFYPGLDIHISDIKHEKDPFGEVNTITLTVMISNMSDKTFSGLDMALVNDYNSVFRPSIFGDTKLMFKQIRPGDKFAGRVSFAVDNVNRNFWLTFYDRRKGTALTKISIDNAYRNVSEKTKKKNQNLRKKKTNFKKEEDLLDIR